MTDTTDSSTQPPVIGDIEKILEETKALIDIEWEGTSTCVIRIIKDFKIVMHPRKRRVFLLAVAGDEENARRMLNSLCKG